MILRAADKILYVIDALFFPLALCAAGIVMLGAFDLLLGWVMQ